MATRPPGQDLAIRLQTMNLASTKQDATRLTEAIRHLSTRLTTESLISPKTVLTFSLQGKPLITGNLEHMLSEFLNILEGKGQEPPPPQIPNNLEQQSVPPRPTGPKETASEQPPPAPTQKTQPQQSAPSRSSIPAEPSSGEHSATSQPSSGSPKSAPPQGQESGSTASAPSSLLSQQAAKGNTPLLTQANSSLQTGILNQKSPSSSAPPNPGAVFTSQQKERMTKEVAVISYLLKGGSSQDETQGGNQKPIETLQTFKKLQDLEQKLGTLQKQAEQESSKHPSEQTNKNIQNTLTQCKKELQDLAAQLKQAGMEKKDEPPAHIPLEKQISILRQKAEQVLTQARTALQESAKSLTEKLRPPPSQQNQTGSAKQERNGETRSQKQAEASPKNPTTQTPGQAKQGETAKDAKAMAQTTPGQTAAKGEVLQRAESKPATTPTMPSTLGNKPEDKGEKTPLLKNRSDLQELVKKSDKKELRLPATVGVVYPMKGKKRAQGLVPVEEKKSPSPNQPPNKDMPEEKGKKGGKTNQESNQEEEDTQYVQPMIFVPERNTILGDPFNEKTKGETAGIIVHIPPFLIATTPIVNLQYAQFLNDAWKDQTITIVEPGIVTDLQGNILFKTHIADLSSQIHIITNGDHISFAALDDKEYYPVVQVSWFGAKAYCSTYELRLPNEQERETAAGMDLPGEHKSLKKFRFGFKSNEIHPQLANYRNDPDTKILPVAFYNGQNEITRGDVKYKTENAYSPYGCYDMSGNVYEWISEGSKTKKIVKGGSYLSPPEDLRVAARKTLDPQTCSPDVSFRVALDIPPS